LVVPKAAHSVVWRACWTVVHSAVQKGLQLVEHWAV